MGSSSHITLKRSILSFKMPSCEEMMVILKYLDLDRDGFITEEEVKKTIIEKNGEDSPFVGEAGEFLALFGQFRDADGKVPLKKIAEFMKTSTDMVEGLGKLFKFFDENGDGKLSKVEAQNGFEMIGKWEGAMKDDFEAMAGEDGKVPIEELMNKLKQ